MYNSNISLDNDGNIVASTDYDGEVAFYLKRNSKVVEKKLYENIKTHTFKANLTSGVISVRFFFRKEDNTIFKYETNLYFFDSSNFLLSEIYANILDEKSGYKITHYDRNSDVTLITFNSTKSDKERKPFGLNFIMNNGWNLISVAQDSNTQYQNLSLEEFHAAVRPVLIDKAVYTYGSSLGGYCAIYYGGCINANIIAASPKNSAHPSIKAPRFENLTFNHKFFDDIPVTTKEVYVVYDSTIEGDVKFINEKIALAYPQPNLLAIENGTHEVLQTLLNAGVLKLYVHSIINKKYNYDISEYIKAKCKYYQGKDKEAFKILESIVKENLEI